MSGSPVIARRCLSCSGPLTLVIIDGERRLVCLKPNCGGHPVQTRLELREGGR